MRRAAVKVVGPVSQWIAMVEISLLNPPCATHRMTWQLVFEHNLKEGSTMKWLIGLIMLMEQWHVLEALIEHVQTQNIAILFENALMPQACAMWSIIYLRAIALNVMSLQTRAIRDLDDYYMGRKAPPWGTSIWTFNWWWQNCFLAQMDAMKEETRKIKNV
jgi:hypothetical protein